MGLLEFARGPALWGSLLILVSGTVWRIGSIFRLKKKPDFSEPRTKATWRGAAAMIIWRMFPRREFRESAAFATTNAYLYHLGLAAIVFGYLPHIEFVKRLTGLSWPPLPSVVFYLAVALTFVSLLTVLMYRLTDPVLRLISGFDDYFSWAIVFLPLVTGMAALGYPFALEGGARIPPDPIPVAIHLLSVELLLVWLPFGKLAHSFLVFISRGMTGAALARKGAAI